MFQNPLEVIENKAADTMTALAKSQSMVTFWDYANIVRKVEKAHKAVNSAYRALNKAEEELDLLK
jgi:hypothetical protein